MNKSTPENPPVHRPRGQRPGSWLTGPDIVTHAQYRAYVQHRNQSNFRNEPWQLTFGHYQSLWKLHWAQRGRTKESYCLTRINRDLPWQLNNTVVITRAQHSARQAQKLWPHPADNKQWY